MNKKGCKISLLITAAILVGGGVLVCLAIFGISSRAPTPEEEALFLSVAVLDDFGVEGLNPEECAVAKTKRHIDGVIEIDYEYDSERAAEEGKPLYFTSTAEICLSEKGARESYLINLGALKAGFVIGGAKTEPISGLDDLGDTCSASFMMIDGQRVGNVISFRQGRIVHSFIVSGIHFGDPEDLRSLFQPIIEASQAFQGAK